jgi:hypothetical protein
LSLWVRHLQEGWPGRGWEGGRCEAPASGSGAPLGRSPQQPAFVRTSRERASAAGGAELRAAVRVEGGSRARHRALDWGRHSYERRSRTTHGHRRTRAGELTSARNLPPFNSSLVLQIAAFSLLISSWLNSRSAHRSCSKQPKQPRQPGPLGSTYHVIRPGPFLSLGRFVYTDDDH